MGPADPFSEPAGRAPKEAHPPPGAPSDRRRARSGSGRRLIGIGFAVGLLFGVLILLFGFGEAVLVLLLGALGALIGWLAHGLTGGGLDVEAAWRALRRRR